MMREKRMGEGKGNSGLRERAPFSDDDYEKK